MDNGVSSLAFTGGEALLREDLPLLLRHAASLEAEVLDTGESGLEAASCPPSLYLLSNGRDFGDGCLEMLADLGVKLSVSLPGIETYAEHTGREGASGVLDLFRRASAAGVATTANVTVTALNLYELERVMSAALVAGADQVLLNRFLPGGRGLGHRSRLELDRQGVLEMLRTAEDVLARADRFGALGTEVPLCVADPADHPGLRISTRCSAAKKFFVVGPSGWIRVCNHSERRLVPAAGWRELRSHPYWLVYSRSDYLPDACSECGKRGLCDAGCREAACITSGSPSAPDPLLDGSISV